MPGYHILLCGISDIRIGPKMVGLYSIGTLKSVRLAKIEDDETPVIAPAALMAGSHPAHILLSQCLHVYNFAINSTFNVLRT
jgi:hypothetical protein